jgi:uncharacterized membrane protein YdfJ with MMPL/SSD domain
MTAASGRDPAPRGNGRGRSMTGSIGSFVVRRARLVLVVAMLAVVGFGVLGLGAFGKLQTGGFADPGAQSTTAQTLTDQRFGGSDGVVLLVHAEAGTVDDAAARDARTRRAGASLPADTRPRRVVRACTAAPATDPHQRGRSPRLTFPHRHQPGSTILTSDMPPGPAPLRPQPRR